MVSFPNHPFSSSSYDPYDILRNMLKVECRRGDVLLYMRASATCWRKKCQPFGAVAAVIEDLSMIPILIHNDTDMERPER